MTSSTWDPGSPVRMTPIDPRVPLAQLYRNLPKRPHGSALLETRGPSGAAILAWDPAATIRVSGGTVQVEADRDVDLPPAPATPAGVLRFLQRITDRFAVAAVPPSGDGPVFLGGLVGYFAYEWAAAQDGPDAARLDGTPDLWFGLFDRAVVRSRSGATSLVVAPAVRGADARGVRDLVECAGRPGLSGVPGPPATTRLERAWGRHAFEEAVRDVRRRIRRGDVYQVDLAVQLRTPGPDPLALYESLQARNPSPFGGYLDGGGVVIASASPERVLHVTYDAAGARLAETRPIAGTRPRGRGALDRRRERALRRSPKERAEHTMLVDLARNDLGRVCALGTVEVDEWLTVERYSHVMHLVSNVRGRLEPGTGLAELVPALLPGGSITGTPKIRATEIIAELEPVPRGPYTGSMGYVSLDGRLDLNLLIRSAFFPKGRAEALFYAGAGIVQDSQPDREWREVEAKAAFLVEALAGSPSRGFRWAPPRRYASWRPPAASSRHARRDVLLIDNYDSFTYNLAQYLSMLGARVRVVRNDATTVAELRARRPTHVVVSPGPGRPSDSGISLPAVRAFEGTPVLGVCLGHQAIIEAYGGSLGVARTPTHGKSSVIHCVAGGGGNGLLDGLAPSFQAARYHSLVARRVPPSLRVTARTADGEVMAVEHRELPTYGVQFHPESLRTERGMTILDRFLEEEPRRG